MNNREDDDDCDPRNPEGVKPTDQDGDEESETSETADSAPAAAASSGTDEPCEVSETSVTNLQSKLLQSVAEPSMASSHKITIVGSGMVGMACAYSILNQRISHDICLIDIVVDKVKGEVMDLQHGSAFLNSARIQGGDDYDASANSKIIVITAGVRQKEGETRLSLLQRNLGVLKAIVPELAAKSPNAIFLVVSNPVDALTYITWKLSGFPQHRVIGSGTNLDTSRFRFLLSERIGVAAESVHGWIIGEHGDSSVALWSSVNIAGVNLKDLNPKLAADNDPDSWKCIHREVVTSAYDVIKLKGYTSWAIGLSVSDLCLTILRNSAKVHCISLHCKGMYGIEDECYLSLPCTLGEYGIIDVVKQKLNDEELQQLRKSAKIMGGVIRELGI